MDVYELCTPALQAKLSESRKLLSQPLPSSTSTSTASANANTNDMEVDNTDSHSSPSPVSNVTGVYDLTAIITHKGRSADSGHYMSYVKLFNKEKQVEEWNKFDDAKVSIVNEEEVLRLAGGGDRDMAYFCIFALRQ